MSGALAFLALHMQMDLLESIKQKRGKRERRTDINPEELKKLDLVERKREREQFNQGMREAEEKELEERQEQLRLQGQLPQFLRKNPELRRNFDSNMANMARNGVIVAHGDQKDNVFLNQPQEKLEEGDSQLEQHHRHRSHDDQGQHDENVVVAQGRQLREEEEQERNNAVEVQNDRLINNELGKCTHTHVHSLDEIGFLTAQ